MRQMVMVVEIKNDRSWEKTFHFELVVLLHLILVSSCSGEIIYGTDLSLFSFPQTSEIHDASTQPPQSPGNTNIVR